MSVKILRPLGVLRLALHGRSSINLNNNDSNIRIGDQTLNRDKLAFLNRLYDTETQTSRQAQPQQQPEMSQMSQMPPMPPMSPMSQMSQMPEMSQMPPMPEMSQMPQMPPMSPPPN